MSVDIRFPDPPQVPDQLPLLRVVRPQWDQARRSLASRLGVEGDATDAGLWLVARDQRSSLEIYQASHSFRFTRQDIDGEARDRRSVEMDADHAVAVAERFLEGVGRVQADSWVHSVTELEVLSVSAGGREPERRVAAMQVNFRFSLNGIALVGPGAKMQVTVGDGDEVIGAYRFWRDVEPTASVRVFPAEHAFERFARSPMFANLTDDTARAEVASAELGYLCLPPTEVQGMLLPVFRLRGTISTEFQEAYDFVSYVAAASVDPEDAKRQRAPQTQPSLVLA
jgi:hypothetical protein